MLPHLVRFWTTLTIGPCMPALEEAIGERFEMAPALVAIFQPGAALFSVG